MKRLSLIVSILFIFLFFTVSAKPKIAVVPIGSRDSKVEKIARQVEKDLYSMLRDIDSVKIKGFFKEGHIEAFSKCKSNLRCMKKLARKIRGTDYYIYSRMKFGSFDATLLKLYLYKGNNKIDSIVIENEDDAFTDEISSNIVSGIKELIKKHVVKSRYEDDFGYENNDNYIREKPVERGPSADELIQNGLKAYREGNIKVAKKALKRASSENTAAKKLYNAVREAVEYYERALKLSNNGNHKDALTWIEKFEKIDKAIRTYGYKKNIFQKEKVARLIYLEPTKKDRRKVNKIHRKFKKRFEQARKDKVNKISQLEKEINDRIRARQQKIKDMVDESENQKIEEKKQKKALTERIKEMKYNWEKEDSELEQKIVAIESKLTYMQQKEKGVIKTSTKKQDDAKAKELAENAKNWKAAKKKLTDEKNAFYKNFDATVSEKSKQNEKLLDTLNAEKKKLEAEVQKIDEKLRKMRDTFDMKEKDLLSKNEGIKMKNEDEDRKYNVTVEKEYQKKFDQLNKKLVEYDEKEKAKQEELAKFDKEIEDFLMKNVDLMSKFQQEIEAERKKLDETYKKDKADAQGAAEKKYNEKLAALQKEKDDIAAEIESFNTETESQKKEKETALKAQKKSEKQIARELKKIDKKRSRELKKLERSLKNAEKAIAKHEKNKDSFIKTAAEKIDEEYDMKSTQLDMKLVKENNRLQKENKAFRKKKMAAKKRSEKAFKRFLKDKQRFKDSIDKQIELAQKRRDRKIEKRKKQRMKKDSDWKKNAERRAAQLERKMARDKRKKENLLKKIETVTTKITKTSGDFADKLNDIKVKHNETSDKFEADWKERMEQVNKEFKDKKAAIVKKYDDMELATKEKRKAEQVKLEEKIQSLNEEKARRKEKRKAILKREKQKWLKQLADWKKDEQKRQENLKAYKAKSKKLARQEKRELMRKKEQLNESYNNKTKKIFEKEVDMIQRSFGKAYKTITKREIEPSQLTAKAMKLKADLLAKQGLKNLQKEDILSARRNFVSALYVNRKNQTAKDGLKAIDTSAKALFWKAYGAKDSNKKEAKRIFKLLMATLMPDNEFFIKSKVELEELN